MKKQTGLTFCAVLLLSACSQSQTNISNSEETDPTAVVAGEVVLDVAQTSCQDPEFRQLDFWVGEWDLEWDLPSGDKGHGTNIITNSPFGDCVITENFDGAPTQNFKGMSVSTFHKPAGVWRQTWVDDQGGYFALSGGVGADGIFSLDMTRLSEKSPYRRMVWRDVTPDSLTWYWQGHSAEDTEWGDLWVIRYTRKKGS